MIEAAFSGCTLGAAPAQIGYGIVDLICRPDPADAGDPPRRHHRASFFRHFQKRVLVEHAIRNTARSRAISCLGSCLGQTGQPTAGEGVFTGRQIYLHAAARVAHDKLTAADSHLGHLAVLAHAQDTGEASVGEA